MSNGTGTAQPVEPAATPKRSSSLVKSDLIAVCAWCEKVRDEHNHWHQTDLVLLANAGLSLTHTICDDCKQEYSRQLQFAYAATVRPEFGAA